MFWESHLVASAAHSGDPLWQILAQIYRFQQGLFWLSGGAKSFSSKNEWYNSPYTLNQFPPLSSLSRPVGHVLP